MVVEESTQEYLTAFPGLQNRLVRGLSSEKVRKADFARRLARCMPYSCQGSCCYDGTFVEPDEQEVLEGVLTEKADHFATLGIEIPKKAFVPTRWPDTPGTQTALKSKDFSGVPDFASHFTNTSCFMLMESGECSLERIACSQGRHRWFYKPLACWLHPIMADVNGSACFRLFGEADEPFKTEAYPGFVTSTRCGRTAPEGESASVVLTDEINYASTILGTHPTAAILAEITGGAQCHVNGRADG